jgi:putative effector of murein hydrolase LrgA (UPF0299 family)
MNARFLKDAWGWGFVLWFIGYALGVVLFAFVPASVIGWIITPFGAALTLWIAFKKLKGDTLRYFLLVGLVWLLIAVVGDYVFIVKAFKPADGYYKPDVYLYYVLTLAIALVAGWRRDAARTPTGTSA